MATKTRAHIARAKIEETAEEALAFIVDESCDSHFLDFKKGFKTEVDKCLGENWKPASLHKLFENTGVQVDESMRRNIRNWVNGKVPDRERAVQICFALRLDYDEANDFLCRVCGQSQLNVKEPFEAICYYCLHFKKSYETAVKLKSDYNKYVSANVVGDDTSAIIKWMLSVENNDEKFIRQLIVRVPPSNSWSERVIKATTALLNGLKLKVSKKLGKEPNKLSYEELANWLLWGVEFSKSNEGVLIIDERDASFKKSSLSRYKTITQNFLTRKKISEIENKKTVPSREQFILLFFFDGCFSKLRSETKDEHFFKNFYSELDNKLDKYGMNPLYSRSAFDWIILKSVAAIDPITYWQEIIGYSLPDD